MANVLLMQTNMAMLIADAALTHHIYTCAFFSFDTSLAVSCGQIFDFSNFVALHSCIHSYMQSINHVFMHSFAQNNCCCDEYKSEILHAKLCNHDQGVTNNRYKGSHHNLYLRASERNEACSVCSIPCHPHICAVIPMDHP